MAFACFVVGMFVGVLVGAGALALLKWSEP
jgi:hypothetical protein